MIYNAAGDNRLVQALKRENIWTKISIGWTTGCSNLELKTMTKSHFMLEQLKKWHY